MGAAPWVCTMLASGHDEVGCVQRGDASLGGFTLCSWGGVKFTGFKVKMGAL